MARGEPDSTVTLSLIDRLIDQEPSNSHEAPISRSQSVRVLKTSLRRDLEWLLNSRRIAEPAPEEFAQLVQSLYHYGLPDFASLTVASPRDRNYLLRTLEEAVTLFEPRLKNVRVTPIETSGLGVRALRFQIEGLLMMDPAPEQISFDTVVQLSTGEYTIKGERSA
jgi:type VI secretion system protein ImpF